MIAWAILALVAAVIVRSSKLLYLLIVLLAFAAGMLRQDVFAAQQPTRTIDNLQYSKQNVTGTVASEPFRDDKTNYVFYLKDLTVGGQPIAGDLRVKSLVASAKEGYRVGVQGKVFPSLGKASSSISYAKVSILSTRQSILVQAKSEFSEGVRRALPEPVGSFMLGILIGARSTLPKELQDTMALIGLSHLIAVSGYNLTIITLAIQGLAGKKWQWASLVGTLWLIVGFVVLTGASASIVRAGIMSTLFLLASYYGRKLEVLTCLALGIIITLMWSPAYISDLSWQLSFLALGGIVLLTPVVRALIPQRFGVAGEIAAVSVAAQIATMPLIAYVFGSISVVAPLANVIFLPFVPILMLLGLLAGLIGMLAPGVAFAAAWPIGGVVNAMLDCMRYLAGLPGAAINGTTPSELAVLAFYALLGTLGLLAHRRGLGSSVANAIITARKEGTTDERTQ
jgi:ComEC/Rec2-related protein